MAEAVPLSSFLLAVSCMDKSVFGVTQLGSMTLPGKQLTAVPLKVCMRSMCALYVLVYEIFLPRVGTAESLLSARYALDLDHTRVTELFGAQPSLRVQSTFERSRCTLHDILLLRVVSKDEQLRAGSTWTHLSLPIQFPKINSAFARRNAIHP